MSFMFATVWWVLPTAAIVQLLRRTKLARWEQWAIAAAAWSVGSGAAVWAGAQVREETRALFLGVTLPTLLVAFCGFLYLRRKYTLSVDDELRFDGDAAQPSRARWLAYGVLSVALFILGGAFSGGIAALGASSEYYAYAAIGKTWLGEGRITDAIATNVVANPSLPLSAWTRFSGALAARAWTPISDLVLLGLLAVTVLGLVATQLRALQFSFLGACAAVALILSTPQLTPALARHSDASVVALFGIACMSSMVADNRAALAMGFALAAFAWNPILGWPLALACALALALRAYRSTIVWCVACALVTLAMIVLQAQTLLPERFHALFSNARPLATWAMVGEGIWIGIVALALAGVAVRRFAVEGRHGAALTFLIMLTALGVIAHLRAWPAYLSSTEGAVASVFLLTLVPCLLYWMCTTALGVTQTLSRYESALERSGTDLPTASVASVTQGAPATPLATPSAAEQLGLPEEITPEAMRGLLMQGYHHLSANALSLAALHAQAALDYDSQHPDAHHLLAQVALRENRPGDALRSVLKSIQVFPEHALYHLTVSEIYGVQQRFNEQAFALQEASRLDPANMGIKTRLLMAKRKAMVQAAERAQQAPQASGEHRAYELIVSENHVRAVKNIAVPADR